MFNLDTRSITVEDVVGEKGREVGVVRKHTQEKLIEKLQMSHCWPAGATFVTHCRTMVRNLGAQELKNIRENKVEIAVNIGLNDCKRATRI